MSTFQVGDRVKVLRAARLPKVEDVIGEGRIVEVIQRSKGFALYVIDGFYLPRTAYVLRRVEENVS